MALARTRAALLVAVLGGLLAWAALAQPARARFGSSCTNTTAEFSIDDDGTAIRASAGYNDTGAVNDGIGVQYKGTDAKGEPVAGGSACGTPASYTFAQIMVLLGDQADELRMDARKPAMPPGYDALPASVNAFVYGGKGNDELRGHKGYDEIYGEGGGDVIRIAGGAADHADCGGRDDKVILSGADVTVDCENVVER